MVFGYHHRLPLYAEHGSVLYHTIPYHNRTEQNTSYSSPFFFFEEGGNSHSFIYLPVRGLDFVVKNKNAFRSLRVWH